MYFLKFWRIILKFVKSPEFGKSIKIREQNSNSQSMHWIKVRVRVRLSELISKYYV